MSTDATDDAARTSSATDHATDGADPSDPYPVPVVAAASDLPRPVADVLTTPAEAVDRGQRAVTEAAGVPFASVAWGDPTARPLVLIHGVTASSRIWWRIAPALAAAGRRVVAVDLPGHGSTGHWRGRHRFRETAADVAAWIRATGLDAADLQIIGHSWGGMVTAALPAAGIRPATLVLLDPPAIPHAVIARMADDPAERPFPDLETAVAALGASNPTWPAEDVLAKAEALLQLDVEAARAVVVDNGDWDGGLADLTDPAAAGIPVWVVRADPAAGGLLPDAAIGAFAVQVGPAHILTMTGAPHAPQRTHAAATTLALLRALGGLPG
jgi:pimeloyl-ACP methyl ester carboxylesterase